MAMGLWPASAGVRSCFPKMLGSWWKCVGCGGTVTAPFQNWRGDEVVFRKKSAVPAAIVPANDGAGRVPAIESLVGAEADDAEQPSVLVREAELFLTEPATWLMQQSLNPQSTRYPPQDIEERLSTASINYDRYVMPFCDNAATCSPVDFSSDNEHPQQPLVSISGNQGQQVLTNIPNSSLSKLFHGLRRKDAG